MGKYICIFHVNLRDYFFSQHEDVGAENKLVGISPKETTYLMEQPNEKNGQLGQKKCVDGLAEINGLTIFFQVHMDAHTYNLCSQDVQMVFLTSNILDFFLELSGKIVNILYLSRGLHVCYIVLPFKT